MGHSKISRVVTALLFSACMAVTAQTAAVESDLYLAGLGLHQETGRNIYLGGIYLQREAPRPSNLTDAAGPRIMEYRVVARRTSIRSLLGGMLLQSEVATGNPPNQATADFIDEILSTVSSSLYAGDALEIRLTDDNATVASLNGHELARVEDKSVADYLLMGWVGETGPSTSFRNEITSEEVDPELLSELQANAYSAERGAEIAALIGVVEEPVAVAQEEETPAEQIVEETTTGSGEQSIAADSAASDTPAEQAEDSAAESSVDGVVAAVAAAAGLTPTATATEPAAEAGTPVIATETATDALAPAGDATADAVESQSAVQVAALVPTEPLVPVNPLQAEVEALSITEYSQRLAVFHSSVIRMVYGEIKYPKRAVRRSLEGRLELDITMTATGDILDVVVAAGSGHELLDDAAVAAAEEAFADGLRSGVDPVAIAEFGSLDSERMTIPVPVSFQLQ